MASRLIVVSILIPIIVALTVAGGWFYYGMMLVIMGRASYEYWRLFHNAGFAPSKFLIVGSTILFMIMRAYYAFDFSAPVICAIVLINMTLQIIKYERGGKTPVADFGITLGGIFYMGWMSAYLISLRELPDGLWWFMLVVPATWLSDGGAFFTGIRYGKHHMSKRISPKKTWEGFAGGVLFATVGTALLGLLWGLRSPLVTWDRGLIIGAVIAFTAPLGDFAESMLKREVGTKDAGGILPGHGGVLDRIDSWMFTVPIGYYLITWLWLGK